ncbi:MAG: MotA/TolQ/ExbB proton channel family protein [Burkholderiales bacterium]|nr:MotA/TolQ/ExbB proton channel family protein [Burkholderiales bacterium]
MPNSATASLGFAHFIGQSDTVSKLLLLTLLVMSVLTWTIILNRVVAGRGLRIAMRRALDGMRNTTHANALPVLAEAADGGDPFQRLTATALAVTAPAANVSGLSYAEILTRSMRNCINEETTTMETGLATLASIASSAPFVGLFGTVWGVYHALVNIGMSGQGTLDKVAGPVGEALLMTAVGLAVAIPATLAYNTFVRRNRLILTKLNSYAHDVFALLAGKA